MGRKKMPEIDEHTKSAVREFGTFAKKMRERIGLTMRDVAEEVKVNSSYISDIENGKERPPADGVLEKLVAVYKIKGEDKRTFYQLAGKGRSTLPAEIVSLLNQSPSLFDAVYTLCVVRDACADIDEKPDNKRIETVFMGVSKKIKESTRELLRNEFPNLYDKNGELNEELRGFGIDL